MIGVDIVRTFAEALAEAVALGMLRCGNCASLLRNTDLSIAAIRSRRCFVRAHCGGCGLSTLLVVQLLTAPLEPDGLSTDDVLEAHQALASMDRLPPEIGGTR